jgi:hypothetical protein
MSQFNPSFSFRFTHSDVDPSNFQLVSFDVGADPSVIGVEQMAAQLVCYFSFIANECFSAKMRVERIQYSPTGTTSYADIPFPQAAYDFLKGANATYPLQAMPLGYGSPLTVINDLLCPLGTSICVTERVAAVRGSGRHYVPFITQRAVDRGRVAETTRTLIKFAYNNFLRGINNPGSVPPVVGMFDLQPIVVGGPSGVRLSNIIEPVPSGVFSNLRSRRR